MRDPVHQTPVSDISEVCVLAVRDGGYGDYSDRAVEHAHTWACGGFSQAVVVYIKVNTLKFHDCSARVLGCPVDYDKCMTLMN